MTGDAFERIASERTIVRIERLTAFEEVARAARDACDYGDSKRIRALAAALAHLDETATERKTQP